MAVTKVTQSFKEKLPNGSWGEEVKLSTISDLIFYSDGKNLTTKTSELSDKIDTEIQDREKAVTTLTTNLNKEIQDRKDAVDGEKNAREAAIKDLTTNLNTEIQDRKDAVSGEATTRASEITRIEGLISSTEKDIEANVKSITEINETTIPNAVSVANDYADGLVDPITKDIDNIKEIIGNMEDIKGDDPEGEDYPLTISEKFKKISEQLSSIEDRLTALERNN